MNKLMTDKEIFKLCSTKQGCLDYIQSCINENLGYDNWCYLPIEHVPILHDLMKEELIVSRQMQHSPKLTEYTLKKYEHE